MKFQNEFEQNELNRREFLRLSLLTSALLMGSGTLLEATESDATSSHGALQPLTPGNVRPEGWLRAYMEKQAAQLGSKLPQVSWPFTAAYWSGEEHGLPDNDSAWWPWEQKAYWIDGATRLAIVLQDEQLMAQARASIDYTLNHAAASGYLGPLNFRNRRKISIAGRRMFSSVPWPRWATQIPRQAEPERST